MLSDFYLGLASPVRFTPTPALAEPQEKHLTPAEQDLSAMRSDWLAVGEYFNAAIDQYALSDNWHENSNSSISHKSTKTNP